MSLMHCLRRVAGVRGLVSPIVLATALGTAAPADAQKPAVHDYVVGPNDVLAVTVFNQEKLSKSYPVGSDGTFQFPYLGSVMAGGLTVRAVENDLRERLGKDLVRNPQVTVSVELYRSQQIFVIGQVRQPQSLQFTGSMTLVEALVRSGSITERAGVEALVVRDAAAGITDPAAVARAVSQASSNDPKVIRVNLEALQNGDLSQNVPLRSGDVVSVPPAKTVFVKGQVAKPGEYPVRPGMTVQQVLALAGGITDRGSEGRIQVTREVDGKKTTLKASTEDVVVGGDLIDVRQRFF